MIDHCSVRLSHDYAVELWSWAVQCNSCVYKWEEKRWNEMKWKWYVLTYNIMSWIFFMKKKTFDLINNESVWCDITDERKSYNTRWIVVEKF